MANSQQDVIKQFMAALVKTTKTGNAALDDAVKACSNFNGVQDAINHMVSDCSLASSASDFLINKCGIILNNEDTGAITGKDAGGSTVKTAKSVVPESGNQTINFSGSSFTTNGLTFRIADASYLNDNEKKIIWQGFYTWWAKAALDLIKESYGYSFSDSQVKAKEIFIIFPDTLPNDWMASTGYEDTDGDNVNDLLFLNVSMDYFGDISANDQNGYADTWPNGYQNYIDRTIVHELTHAIMAAKLKADTYDSLPGFVCEGLADLTHGLDDKRYEEIQTLAANPSSLKNYLNTSSTSATTNSYVAGYMFFRYLAKQAANSEVAIIENETTNKVVRGTSAADTISNTAGGVTILGGAGNDSIYSNTEKPHTVKSGYGYVTIDGGTGNDTIYNYDPRVSINGGAGNDSIYIDGYPANITIRGGTGNDTITYKSQESGKLFLYQSGDGNDIIQNAGTLDTISIGGASFSTSASGSDVIVKVGSNSIRLKSAKNNMPKILGSSTPTTTLLVTNSTKSPVTVDSAIKTIDARQRTSAVKITGNSLANTIYSGKGNDTLTGGNGADVFVYASGQGNDVITDYTAGQDKIKITGAKISKTSVSGNDVILSVNSGSIRVKNGKGKKFSIYNNSSSAINTVISAGNDNSTSLTITNSSSSPVSLGSAIKTANANSRTSNLLVVGNNKGNTIIGGSGKNTVIGGTGADLITGGKSADELYGGKGNDTLVGNAGNDYISANEGNDYVSGGAGDDSLFGGTGNDSLYGIDGNDYISANEGNDYLNGGAGNDSLFGGAGNDSIYGDNGNDYISANEGNDYVNGGAGNDSLWGGAGNDTLYGGAGNDTLWGGTGKDVFIYKSGDGNDVIADFTIGEDILNITGDYTQQSRNGNLILKFSSGTLTLKDISSI